MGKMFLQEYNEGKFGFVCVCSCVYRYTCIHRRTCPLVWRAENKFQCCSSGFYVREWGCLAVLGLTDRTGWGTMSPKGLTPDSPHLDSSAFYHIQISLNPGPCAHKTSALPIEPSPQSQIEVKFDKVGFQLVGSGWELFSVLEKQITREKEEKSLAASKSPVHPHPRQSALRANSFGGSPALCFLNSSQSSTYYWNIDFTLSHFHFAFI